MARRRRRGKPKFTFKIPFLDRGRPGSPYVKDSQWTIQQHEPLPPFGDGYRTRHRRGPAALAQMREEQLPHSIYCLANQPPGPEPRDDTPRLVIEVVEALRPPLAQGSQVVACRVIGGGSRLGSDAADADRLVVAKIFDPLYYYHNGDYDIAELADMEYCREAAAYEHLQRAGVDGQWLPGYLGSFTLDVPLTDDQRFFLAQFMGADHPLLQPARPVRRVRLVLVEKVVGQAMTFQLVFGGVEGLPDAARLDVVASTLEAYAHLYFHGVVHGDLAPRNVFLRDEADADIDGDGSSTGPRPTVLRFHRFVDLGLAYVLGAPASALPRQPACETRPRNPIQLFWNVFDSGAANMYFWLPRDMRNTPAFQRWMLRRWYGDDRFEPVGPMPEPESEPETDAAARAQDAGAGAGTGTGIGTRTSQSRTENGDDAGVGDKGMAAQDTDEPPPQGEALSLAARTDGVLRGAVIRAAAVIPGIKTMAGWRTQKNAPASTITDEGAGEGESDKNEPREFW